jgi:predicted alpha/beta-hydrolase family hydrolase
VAARDVETPHGPARVHVTRVDRPRAALVLGHGAGGGVQAPDLVAAARGAHDQDLVVALVEQPYRVAGRRSPAPARQLDAAWVAVVDELREHELRSLPLVVGGRSSGARVACRTAVAVGAVGVLCLAFPLRPPGRPGAPDRLEELDAVPVPTLVVQGASDAFGTPPAGPRRQVVRVDGDHSLRRDTASIERAVAAWLADQTAASVRSSGRGMRERSSASTSRRA